MARVRPESPGRGNFHFVPCDSLLSFVFPTVHAVWKQTLSGCACSSVLCGRALHFRTSSYLSVRLKMADPDSSSGTPPPHEIIVVPPPGHEGRQLLLDQCINVRIDVFVHEQQFPLDVEVDEYVILFRIAPPYLHSSSSIPTINMSFTSTGKIRQQPISCSGWYLPLHQSGQSEPTERRGRMTTSSAAWLFSSRTGNIVSGAISCSCYIDGSKTMRSRMERCKLPESSAIRSCLLKGSTPSMSGLLYRHVHIRWTVFPFKAWLST